MKFLSRLSIAAVAVLYGTLISGNVDAATYRMIVQSPPEAGGRCLFVPNLQSANGTRLQMLDCNNTVGQIFIYDDQSQQLKISELCAESDGRGMRETPSVSAHATAGPTNVGAWLPSRTIIN